MTNIIFPLPLREREGDGLNECEGRRKGEGVQSDAQRAWSRKTSHPRRSYPLSLRRFATLSLSRKGRGEQ
jgi:hypothetical protein